MSDSSQIIVDIEVTLQQATGFAERVRDWLISEGIIEHERSDSVFGGEGHRPGKNYGLASEPDADFLTLRTNGVEVEVGRRVFHAGQNGLQLRCDACGQDFDLRPPLNTPSFNAVGIWFGGDDTVSFSCPQCGQHKPLTEWRGPWQWGFGNLGFRFWNWPPLSAAFVQSVSRELGYRTVVVRHHL